MLQFANFQSATVVLSNRYQLTSYTEGLLYSWTTETLTCFYYFFTTSGGCPQPATKKTRDPDRNGNGIYIHTYREQSVCHAGGVWVESLLSDVELQHFDSPVELRETVCRRDRSALPMLLEWVEKNRTRDDWDGVLGNEKKNKTNSRFVWE